MGMNGIIDALFLVSGIYLIVSALMAKGRGVITANVMLGKNMSEQAIKDKIGFIEYMYKRMLVSGILIVIGGMINFINDCYYFSKLVTAAATVVILGAVALYVVAYKKGTKKYM